MSDIAEFKSRFQRLLELREQRDITATQAKKAEKAYRAYEAELYEAVWDAGVRGRLTFDFGPEVGTASFQAKKPTIYGRVIDADAAIAALRQEGLSEIIYSDAVRQGRLNELVRDRLESKGELPEGIDFYDKRSISISRK